ncbi:MAG: cation:proton antiporter [Nitrospinota bacterium]|nr:cation:proton antiporter [Nitrospinota bacterium]
MIVWLFILSVLFVTMSILPSLPGALPAHEPVYTTAVLGFLLLASLFIGKASGRMKLPMITGYIIGGMLFGPWGMKILSIEDLDRLQFINHLALSFIALSAGAELEWGKLQNRIMKITGLTTIFVITVFFTVFASFLVFFKAGFGGLADPRHALFAAIFIGIIATVNSPDAAIAVINETGAKGTVSQTVLSVSVLKDVLVIMLFALTVSMTLHFYQSEPGADTTAWSIFLATGKTVIMSAALGGAIAGIVAVFFSGFASKNFIFISGLAVLCSELSAMLGLNELVLCVTAGFALRSLLASGNEFVLSLEKGSMPVFVVFFAMAGASIDLYALQTTWGIALFYVVLRMLLIWATTTGVASLMKEKPLVKKHLWSGFVPQAGVTLGLVMILESNFPSFGYTVSSIIIASVAVNLLVGPVLFKYSLQECGETEKKVYNGEGSVETEKQI